MTMMYPWPVIDFGKWATKIGARLLAGMMTDPEVLALCDDVETNDFNHPHQRCAFAALRELQARGEPIGLFEIAAEIRRRDAFLGTFASDYVDEGVMADWLLETRSYRTDYRVEKHAGRTWINGVEVDWDKYIANAAELERRVPGCRTVFDMTDEAKANMKISFVRIDAERLQQIRIHLETDHDNAATEEVPDEHQPIRERCIPHRQRARGSSRQRRT